MAKKEKSIQEDIPKTPEQLAKNVNSYFDSEINERITSMSLKEMENLMKDFVALPHWIAILKYRELRSQLLDATLRSTDPVKEPSKISWAQGALAGLCDVETYVIDLNAPRSIPEDESTEIRQDGVIMG